MPDVDEAIELSGEAVRRTPNDHPDRATYLNNLGLQLQERYSTIGSRNDFEKALHCDQLAMRQSNLPSLSRIETCLNILRFSAVISDWQQAYDACDIGASLIRRLGLRSFENSDKQHAPSPCQLCFRRRSNGAVRKGAAFGS